MARPRTTDPLAAFIDQLADAIASRIKASTPSRAAASPRGGARKKGQMSAEGLARIRAAQKKRWAAWRQAKGKD
jgi:hypothetical protein